jgi:hypothetical protein
MPHFGDVVGCCANKADIERPIGAIVDRLGDQWVLPRRDRKNAEKRAPGVKEALGMTPNSEAAGDGPGPCHYLMESSRHTTR